MILKQIHAGKNWHVFCFQSVNADPSHRTAPRAKVPQRNELHTGHATTGTTNQHTSRTVKHVACFVDQGVGDLPILGRHLPIHGGRQQNGRRGECIFHSFVKKIEVTSNIDSLVSDGEV